jgi:hypothetical protein
MSTAVLKHNSVSMSVLSVATRVDALRQSKRPLEAKTVGDLTANHPATQNVNPKKVDNNTY